jgi:hypothetical protein
MTLIRTLLHARTARLGAMVVAVIALGSATGVAFAQETSEQSTAGEQSTTSDTTTSTSDLTTSTTDSTTTDSTTTTDKGTTTDSSEDLASTADQTTTTSDELNQLAAVSDQAETRAPSDENCATGGWAKIDGVANGDTTRTVTLTDINTVEIVFTFVFNADKTAATWSSSAPFTGEILVKSGSDPASITQVNAATTGTITTPGTNNQGVPQAISHVCVRGVATTTTTTTSTTTAVSKTTNKQGAAGTINKGGGTGGTGGTSAVVSEATTAKGGLPFTGLHAPLMVLVALGMGAAGLALRKRVNGSA